MRTTSPTSSSSSSCFPFSDDSTFGKLHQKIRHKKIRAEAAAAQQAEAAIKRRERMKTRSRRKDRILICHDETPGDDLVLRMMEAQELLRRANERIVCGLAVTEGDWNTIRDAADRLAYAFRDDVDFEWEMTSEGAGDSFSSSGSDGGGEEDVHYKEDEYDRVDQVVDDNDTTFVHSGRGTHDSTRDAVADGGSRKQAEKEEVRFGDEDDDDDDVVVYEEAGNTLTATLNAKDDGECFV